MSVHPGDPDSKDAFVNLQRSSALNYRRNSLQPRYDTTRMENDGDPTMHRKSKLRKTPNTADTGTSQQRLLDGELTKEFMMLNQHIHNNKAHVDFLNIDDLIRRHRANINNSNAFTGETLLHIVAARGFHYHVAEELIKRGADVNAKDHDGVTPMHVAAATNYSKLINVLYVWEADITAKNRAGQTPLHYAACNDALEACKALVRLMRDNSVSIDVEDVRKRTPLFAAVELGRSISAQWLVERGADVEKQDASERSCLTIMMKKMSRVAKFALGRYHEIDVPNRKERFHLNDLRDLILPEKSDIARKTPLQFIVDYNQLDVVMHPVIAEILKVKWYKFGRKQAFKDLGIYLVYIVLWTVLGVGVSWQTRYRYDLPNPDTWRIIIWIAAIIATLYFVALEIREYVTSQANFRNWRSYRKQNISDDKAQYPPMSGPNPNVITEYLEHEETDLLKMQPSYFRDFWNWFDWTIYATNILVFILHMIEVAAFTADNRAPPCCGVVGCDVTARLIRTGELTDLSACSASDASVNNGSLSVWLNRFIAINVIMMWLGLIKHLRPFRHLGPLIVMLTKVLADVGWFLVLFLIFYVAYVFAFWIIFGLHTPINSMSTVDQIMFSLYRITLVDEYQYDQMHAFDIVMTYILVGSFLVISAVLCINILIALLSDTFHRVYSNAKATARMQQAIFLMKIEEGLTTAQRADFKSIIRKKYNPEEVDISDQQDYGYNEESDFAKMRALIEGYQRDNIAAINRILQNISRVKEEGNKPVMDGADFPTQRHQDIPVPTYHVSARDDIESLRGASSAARSQSKRSKRDKQREPRMDALNREPGSSVRDQSQSHDYENPDG